MGFLQPKYVKSVLFPKLFRFTNITLVGVQILAFPTKGAASSLIPVAKIGSAVPAVGIFVVIFIKYFPWMSCCAVLISVVVPRLLFV
jgi:hypothetical protein